MTWDLPWVASGSAEIPLDVARAFTYAATDGVSGIIGQPFSNVLKITQTGTASSSVQTAAGGFVAVSKFTGASNESYVGRNDNTISTTVPATTASSRSDLVYAHVTDPSQAGQPATASVVETRVITGVPSNTTSLNAVSGYETQTGLALARIDRPSGTSTVTQAQIIDLRVSALSSQIGDLKPFVGSSVNIGQNWELCDGTAVSRTGYPELFAMIGTTFGAGNGSTTFNKPDFRGRVVVGAGQGTGLTNRVLGATGGEENHALTGAENGPHTHPIPTATTTGSSGSIHDNSGNVPAAAPSFPTLGTTTAATSSSGSGTPHNVMQPWAAANYLIRVR